MIGETLGVVAAMAAVAALFALFGALRVPDRRRGCGGSCAGCESGCDIELEGRRS